MDWSRSRHREARDLLITCKLGHVFTLSQADVVPASVSLSSSACSATQSFRDSAAASKACPCLRMGGRGRRGITVAVERVQQQTDQANHLLRPITSRSICWAMPHSNPSESPTTDVWSCSTMSKGSWYCYQIWVAGFFATPEAGHLYPQPVAPYRDPQAPTQAPASPRSFVYLALSLLHSCPCLWPVACCPIFCLPQVGWLYFPAFLIYCGWFMATLFQITAYPSGDFGRKEMASNILPFPFSQG